RPHFRPLHLVGFLGGLRHGNALALVLGLFFRATGSRTVGFQSFTARFFLSAAGVLFFLLAASFFLRLTAGFFLGAAGLFLGLQTGCFFRLTLRFQTLLLFDGLTLHVGTLLAHFHVHGFRFTGGTRRLDGAGGATFEGDFLGLRVLGAMGLTQMREQLLLLFIGDHITCVGVRKSGVLHLRKQRIHRNLHNLCQTFYGRFCHVSNTLLSAYGGALPHRSTYSPAFSSSNQGARAVMIN